MQAEDREYFDEVVFLGEATDVADEGGRLLEKLSQIDRYTFDQQKIGFYWNDDKECFKKYNLDPENLYLLMLTGNNPSANAIPLDQSNF